MMRVLLALAAFVVWTAPASAEETEVDRLIACIESMEKHASGNGTLVEGPATDLGPRKAFILPGTRLGAKGFYAYVGRLFYRNSYGDVRSVPGGVYFFASKGLSPGDNLALTFPDDGSQYADRGFTRVSDRTFFRESGFWNAHPRLTRPSQYLPETFDPPLKQVYRQPKGVSVLDASSMSVLASEAAARLNALAKKPPANLGSTQKIYLLQACKKARADAVAAGVKAVEKVIPEAVFEDITDRDPENSARQRRSESGRKDIR
jgi:hypothetical protein